MSESFDSLLNELLRELAGPRLLDHLLESDELLCKHALADANSRLRIRIDLYRHLIAAAWQPPAVLLGQLDRDEQLLRLPAK